MKSTKLQNTNMKQKTKKLLIPLALFLVLGFFLYQVQEKVLAERSGSSPESGVTSRIKTIYDSVVSLSHGSDSAGGWGNWGVMWNRIRSAAEWVPSGDATEADVATGKTFYSDGRTQKTGTAPAPFDYSTQELATKDDRQGTYKGEESTWTAVSGSPFAGFGAINLLTGTVRQDTRTGLWWSASSTTFPTNEFTLSEDGSRPTGGQAIAFCDALNTANYGGHDDWYLPTQKELMTAYINGIYSQDPDFTTLNGSWSSTQVSTSPTYVYLVFLADGITVDQRNFYPDNVRCVRRDEIVEF